MDDMTPTRLGELGPLKDELQKNAELAEAMKILCPRPENRSETLTRRIGIDKLGHYRYFESERGKQRFEDWRHGRELTNAEFKKFAELSKRVTLHTRNGPLGCFLFFHHDEPEDTLISFATHAAK